MTNGLPLEEAYRFLQLIILSLSLSLSHSHSHSHSHSPPLPLPLPLPLTLTLTLSLSLSLSLSLRWLFNPSLCTVYAFCGVLFGLSSLTNLTVLSSVCWLKVCCPNYGKKKNLQKICIQLERPCCPIIIITHAR